MAKSKTQRKALQAEEARRNNAPAVDNRRARHEFHILESMEAGIALTGTEIKSIRQGGISLNEAYARVRDGELWLLGMHVPPYKQGVFRTSNRTGRVNCCCIKSRSRGWAAALRRRV